MYTVDWQPAALRELEAMHAATDAPMRLRIESVVKELNARLTADAIIEGESRDGRRRVVLESPVGLLFDVHVVPGCARVLACWTF